MRPQVTPVSISVPLAQELPDGYTGLLSGRGAVPALFGPEFVPIVRSYNNQVDIGINSTGCNGRCRTTVKAAGFAVNCSSSTAPFSLEPPLGEDGFFSVGKAMETNATVFMTSFAWESKEPGTINMNVQYKGDHACKGELTVRNCTLRAATTKYKVLVNSNRSAINIDPDTTIHNDVVDRILRVAGDSVTEPSTLGGIWLALNNKFRSTAHLRFIGARGYELVTTGATAIEYALVGANHSDLNNCTLKFGDPTEQLLALARELIFRTAVAAAAGNDSQVQTVQAIQVRDRAVYESNMLFLALATAATALGTLAVLPTFYGYWTLGRTTSLSPIETAKAFNAPLLRSPDSNAEVDELLDRIGGRRVRYGMVTCKDQGAHPNDEAMSSSGHPCERRLEMANPDHVRSPPVGEVFSGY
ncbi:MAG: hypothetical protein M1832_002938 [Thelocarpon impressellum]|nr:MAG: hypothetical protein M1832_002938 [Thelocarpon impressellum]